jgi:hypothetical protein
MWRFGFLQRADGGDIVWQETTVAHVAKEHVCSIEKLNKRTFGSCKNTIHKELEDEDHQPKSQRSSNHVSKNAEAKYLVDETKYES